MNYRIPSKFCLNQVDEILSVEKIIIWLFVLNEFSKRWRYILLSPSDYLLFLQAHAVSASVLEIFFAKCG